MGDKLTFSGSDLTGNREGLEDSFRDGERERLPSPLAGESLCSSDMILCQYLISGFIRAYKECVRVEISTRKNFKIC